MAFETTERTASGLKYSIDMENEKFGAKVSIAHLAVFSFNGWSSDNLGIDAARTIVLEDWEPELEDYELEYGLSFTATFKDGSRLDIGAWYMEPSLTDEDY